MPIDPNIALGFQAPQIKSSLNALMDASRVYGAMDQFAQRDAQMAKQAQLTQLMQDSGGDLDKVKNALIKTGDWEGALNIHKMQQDAAQRQADADWRKQQYEQNIQDRQAQRDQQQQFHNDSIAMQRESLAARNQQEKNYPTQIAQDGSIYQVLPNGTARKVSVIGANAPDGLAPPSQDPNGIQSKTTAIFGKSASEKAPTESQANSALFAARAEEADNLLKSTKYDPISVNALLGSQGIPVFGAAANAVSNPETQQVAQAMRNFVTAVLRKESGASISKSEFDTAYQQYFPQPGDDPQTIAQKAITRETAIKGLKNGAGSANFTAPKSSKNIPPGYVLHQDAAGNKAYVGPNNEIIEVQ